MRLPKILIIDDELGRDEEEKGRFCRNACIKEAGNDNYGVINPIAEAVFISGQKIQLKSRENDLESIIKVAIEGWAKWPRWALILIDLYFNTGKHSSDSKLFGFKIAEEINKNTELKEIPIILLSSQPREEREDEIANTTSHFVDKSTISKEKMEEALTEHGLIEDDRIDNEKLIGHSIEWLKCLREARKRARTGNQQNILLLGETGTGKDPLSKYIYEKSKRKGEYVSAYVHGVPEDDVEDLLFGHIKGSFTSASYDRPGAAEKANNGVLFIDEFGDISPKIQTKMLQLLDTTKRECQRIGSDKINKLNLIVVAATNRNEILKDKNNFRFDLLTRVGEAFPIMLPPLRERKEDIIPLSEYFVEKYEREFNAEKREITVNSKTKLLEYKWPGNVRELMNVIERAVYRNKTIRRLIPEHLEISNNDQKSSITISDITTTNSEITNETKVPNKSIMIASGLNLEQDNYYGKGGYPKLEKKYAEITALLIKNALEKTRKISGKISYLEAVRYLFMDSKINGKNAGSRARNIIMRLMKIASNSQLYENDKTLKELREELGLERKQL